MSDIFLSYNREDQAVARLYAQAFELAGLSVWWDTALRAGEAYDEVTEAALRGAKAVVVLWSPRSVLSRWVRAEATLAERAKTLLPVMIEPCDRPIMFELTQTADLTTWSGSSADPTWIRFVEDVRQFIGRHHSAGSAPPSAAVNPSRKAAGASTLLAVLAFDNLSDDENLTYFSDGVSEEILYTVSRTKDLKVIGKASSFQFRGSEKSPLKVASVLKATHLLDGSVRRAGDNIRINVELIDARTHELLWRERYDRALTDIFALQDEIAASVATALQRHFAPASAPGQVDPVAYDLYLQARAIFSEDSSWADQERCAALLEGAVALDPSYAQAWGFLAVFRRGAARVEAANRGLELNPDCATSLTALSFNLNSFSQHGERLALMERAFAEAPDSPFVTTAYIATLLSLGYISPAIEQADLAFARDPLSAVLAGTRALLYCYVGRNQEARRFVEELQARASQSDFAKFIAGAVAIYTGDLDKADAIADSMSSKNRVLALRPPVAFMRSMLALDPGERGKQIEAFLQRKAPACYLLDVGLASVVGEVDLAIRSLLSALGDGRPILFTADNDGRDPTGATVTTGLFMPAFRPIRFDPRFAEICVRLGVYQCWREADRWPDCVAEVASVYDLKAQCALIAEAFKNAPAIKRVSAN